MKIVITGGAGFIGSTIADEYLKLGLSVAVLDDFSGGKRENVPDSCTVYEGSITDAQFVAATFQEYRPDIVSHHAAQVSVAISARDPRLDADLNVLGTITVVQAAIAAGARKIIFPSSGGTVYGAMGAVPVRESDACNPVSPYGLSKHTAERYIRLLCQDSRTDYTILRYSNVYGPRQDPHGEAGVSAIFSLRMIQGQPVTIFGKGAPIRDYVYIQDVVAANCAALEKGEGEAINICSGQGTSTMEVYEALKVQYGYGLEPEFAPWRPGDAALHNLSPDKAFSCLGWKSRYSFAEGVSELADWYRAGQPIR